MDGASEKRRAARGRAARHDAETNVRMPARTRELIDSAASLVGKTRTELVPERARQHAADVLLDQRLLSLDEASYAAFIEVLDKPPAPSEQLEALLAGKAPWER